MMPNGSQRAPAARQGAAESETPALAGDLEYLAVLIVNAARTRAHRRAMWRYRRAGYQPYPDHTAAPPRG